MQRPDLDTLACVNPECHLFRRPGEANLTVRKIYGHDRIRLLRCRTCGEAFSERRGTALFNTKRPEAKAEDVISHLGEGCSVRATARLVKVAKETVAYRQYKATFHAAFPPAPPRATGIPPTAGRLQARAPGHRQAGG